MGEWLQIKFPYSFILTEYTIQARIAIRIPRVFHVVGSNDGTTWNSLYYGNYTNNTNGLLSFTNVLTNYTSYSYYRIVVNAVYEGAAYGYTEFIEWKMKGGSYSVESTDSVVGNASVRINGRTQISYQYNPSGITFNRDNFTVSVWVKVPDFNNYQRFFHMWGVILSHYSSLFRVQQDKEIIFPSVSSNVWSHIVVVINGTSQKTYLNNQLIDDKTDRALAGTTTSASSFNIGLNTNEISTSAIDYVDDVRFYKRSLTASEIEELYRYKLPGSPTSVSAVAGSSQAIVSFTPPVNNGGSPITSYTVTSNPGGITATDIASPITVTGLTNETSYTFTVVATNSMGNSNPSSASNSIVPVFSLNADNALLYYYPFENTYPGKETWNYNRYFVDGINSVVNNFSTVTSFEINSSIKNVGASSIHVTSATGDFRTATTIPSASNFSFFFWVYTTSTATGRIIELFLNSGSILWAIGSTTYAMSATTGFGFSNNIGVFPTKGDSKWHHIGVVVDNGYVRQWSDGVKTFENSTQTMATGTTLELRIGSTSGSTTGSIVGRYLDDVRFYTRALSDQEVTSIYNYRGTL